MLAVVRHHGHSISHMLVALVRDILVAPVTTGLFKTGSPLSSCSYRQVRDIRGQSIALHLSQKRLSSRS